MSLNLKRPALLLLSFLFLIGAAFAQEEGGNDDDVAPAPASIGADIPLTYFGPAPSQVQRELIGPYHLLKAGAVDVEAGTITLPLYRGQMASGESVWYIVTDTNDEANAAALGLNHSSKLTYADVGRGARRARLEPDASLTFMQGTVDFSPERMLTPGEAPNFFPPAEFQPGAVGDENYSPLVMIENAGGYIYNAPMVAFDVAAEELNLFCDGDVDHSLMHDKVVSICPQEQTVTLELTAGAVFRQAQPLPLHRREQPARGHARGRHARARLRRHHRGPRRLVHERGRAHLRLHERPHGRGQPAPPGLKQRYQRRQEPLKRLGRHPHHRHRLQPLVGHELRRVDARGHRRGLPEQAHRGVPDPGLRRGRLGHRSGRRALRVGRHHRQLSHRLPLPLNFALPLTPWSFVPGCSFLRSSL